MRLLGNTQRVNMTKENSYYYSSRNEWQCKELTEDTGMKRSCLLPHVSVAVMIYTLNTCVA